MQDTMSYVDMHAMDSFVQGYLRNYIRRNSHLQAARSFTEAQLTFIARALAESSLRLPYPLCAEILEAYSQYKTRLLPDERPVDFDTYARAWDEPPADPKDTDHVFQNPRKRNRLDEAGLNHV